MDRTTRSAERSNTRPATGERPAAHRLDWLSSDESFRALVENVGEGVGIVDEHERFVFVNEAGAMILGVPAEDLIGRALQDFVAEDEWKRVTEESRRRRSGQRSVYDLALLRPDGTKRDVIVTASPTYDRDGNYRGTYGVFRDITERKATEELVERRSRNLAERVKELQCLYAVMRELHQHGRSIRETVAKAVELVPSGWQYPEIACCRITLEDETFTSKRFRETPWRMAADIAVRDATVGSVEVFYTEKTSSDDPFLKEEERLLGAIAEQMAHAFDHAGAEERLLRSQETAQTLLDNYPGGAVLLDLDYRVVAINAPAAEMTPRSMEDIIGAEVHDLFDTELSEHRVKVLRTIVRTGEPVTAEEHYGDRVYSTQIHPVLGGDGAVERLAVFTRDVTDELRRERALRRSEAKYRSMFELSPEAIVLLDRKGNVVDVNGRIEDWLGYSRDDIVGRNLLFLPFIPKSSKRRIMKRFLERMAGKPIQPYDLTFLTKNGDERVGRIHGTVLMDDEGRTTNDLVMISDVSEQKRAEVAMAEAGQKLEGLHGVVKRLAACTRIDEIYPLVTEAASGILSIDACGFFVEKDGMLSLAATCCRGREEGPPPVPVEEAGHLGEAFRTGRMQLFTNDDAGGAMPAPEGFVRGLSMPAEGVGVLHCFSMKEGAFTTDDVRLADLLLDHARQAAERISLQERLREEAIRDRLTGLYNRNYFDEAAGRETERSRRSGEPIGFLMLDIDRFKLINDTYGHQMGDEVLRGVARFLLGQVRTSEIVVRYGGDEFLVMMPGLTGEPGPVCDRIREAFERWRETSGIPEDVDFGLSMGFARWEPYELETVEESLAQADEAMYADKRSHVPPEAARRNGAVREPAADAN